MANDIDQFPVYDPLIRQGSPNMSDVWVGSMTSFYMNLIGYLSQLGIFIPKVTTAQRDQIQTPQAGQMIYNTSINLPQIYIAAVPAGSWKTVTLT